MYDGYFIFYKLYFIARKLTLEAQLKLHTFLESIKDLSTWIDIIALKLDRLSKEEEKFELDARLRLLSDLRIELNAKRQSVVSLTEKGKSLVQHGHLSSMEVESKLGDINNGFWMAEDSILEIEKSSLQSISLKVNPSYFHIS